MLGQTQGSPWRQRLAPAGFGGGHTQDPGGPGARGQMGQAEVQGVPAGQMGQFIHTGLHGKGVVGMAHGAPGTYWNGGVHSDVAHSQMRDVVDQMAGAIHSCWVEAFFEGRRVGPGIYGRRETMVWSQAWTRPCWSRPARMRVTVMGRKKS